MLCYHGCMKYAVVLTLVAFSAPARADVCVQWTLDPTPILPPTPSCVEWAPSTPPGWIRVPTNYQPAMGELKICSAPGAAWGVCDKRVIPLGQNVVLDNLGEYETPGPHGTYRIRSYWFNLARESTTSTANNGSCPSCTTVGYGLSAGLHNGDIPYVIRWITARN